MIEGTGAPSRRARSLADGSEARRALLAAGLGVALGLFVAVFSRREQPGPRARRR